MTYEGQVQNGVVVLEKGVALPEGTKVRVKPVERPEEVRSEPPRTLAERYRSVIGIIKDLPEDFTARSLIHRGINGDSP